MLNKNSEDVVMMMSWTPKNSCPKSYMKQKNKLIIKIHWMMMMSNSH